MIDDRAVSTVQTALAETRWLPVPCPTEYLPALARDVLWALEKAGMEVVELSREEGMANYGLSAERGRVFDDLEGYSHSPAKARALASALLSAAVAAESVSVVATPQEQP